MSKRRPNVYHHPEDDPVIEWLAWLMDDSIHIGPWGIGLDGFLGLIPGIGDIAGAAVSSLIIARAMQSGIHKSAIMRMVANVGIDALAGAVPFFGDLFDFAFKANRYNVQIYREAIRGEREPIRDWLFISFVTIILIMIVVLPILGLVYLAKLLIAYMQ